MKKLLIGALALALFTSVISCREENHDSVEENIEDTSINEEANLQVETENEVMEAEATVDSLETTEVEVEQEQPQI
jgi:hypothetical protein